MRSRIAVRVSRASQVHQTPQVGRPQIELIHQLGKKAWVYTVDDLDKARLFMIGGIDGIITNVPAEVVPLGNTVTSAKSRASGAGGN